jgi:gas vesicle protein
MRSTVKLLEGAAVGAAAAYMFDPDRGRARRARLRDQVAAGTRRTERRAAQRGRDVAHRLEGAAFRKAGRGRFHPADDRATAEHLRAVLASLDVATPHLTTEVVDRVVRVRGEIATKDQMDRVLDAVACQPGVDLVENLMHLPGELPPNKAAALTASPSAVPRRD